jgi:hypothetical protein
VAELLQLVAQPVRVRLQPQPLLLQRAARPARQLLQLLQPRLRLLLDLVLELSG